MRLLLLVVAWHYQLAYLLAERSPQERDDLRAGAVIARRKGCLAYARGHAVHVAPRHRFIRPFGHIGERQVEHPRAREALALRLSAAVDHGRSLRTGTDVVRAEGRLRQTGDDAGARRPADSFAVVRALVHIRERHPVIHHGRTGRAPEEGDDLRAGAGIVGSEHITAHAVGNAVFHRPIHRVLIIAAGGYIHKHAGLGVAVGFHKDDLDGMGSADILKGVGLHRADALAVDLDVGDSIALVWGDGKGLIPALADADIAGRRD